MANMSDNDQQRIYLFSQKVFDCPNLDKMLSSFQILCNIYSFNVEEEKMTNKIKKMIIRIKDFRRHKLIRKQDVITELKVDADDLISEMLKDIDPKNIFAVDAFNLG